MVGPSLLSVWLWSFWSVLLLGPIQTSPVLTIPGHLAPAIGALGGGIYTTIWFVAVCHVRVLLYPGLIVHVNIGVGGVRSTTKEQHTVSNTVS